MKIELTSATYRVTAITKKTTAILFGNIRVGDIIRFKMYMRGMARASGGGVYASVVTVENITQGTSDRSKSQTEVSNILGKHFEIEEVSE